MKRSLRERAKQAEPIHVRQHPDVSKGRGYDPLAPHEDGLARIMITRAPMMNTDTGEVFTTIHVDCFNCSTPKEARDLYYDGQPAVEKLTKEMTA